MIIADYMEVVTNQLLLFCLQISQFCNYCCSFSVIFIEFEIQKVPQIYDMLIALDAVRHNVKEQL